MIYNIFISVVHQTRDPYVKLKRNMAVCIHLMILIQCIETTIVVSIHGIRCSVSIKFLSPVETSLQNFNFENISCLKDTNTT